MRPSASRAKIPSPIRSRASSERAESSNRKWPWWQEGLEPKKMRSPVPACGSSLRGGHGPPGVEAAIDLLVALDGAHVPAGLRERDPLGEHLGIVHPDALRPAVDPAGAR